MNNKLKFASSLVIATLLNVSCQKESKAPISIQTNTPEQTHGNSKLAFQAKLLPQGELSGTPALSFENTPVGTKQFIIFMEGGKNEIAKKLLWVALASGDVKQIDPQVIGTLSTQATNGVLNNLIPLRRAKNLTSVKTEIFAINRELLPEELNQLKATTRESFKKYCLSKEGLLLGATIALDPQKIKEQDEKDEAKQKSQIETEAKKTKEQEEKNAKKAKEKADKNEAKLKSQMEVEAKKAKEQEEKNSKKAKEKAEQEAQKKKEQIIKEGEKQVEDLKKEIQKREDELKSLAQKLDAHEITRKHYDSRTTNIKGKLAESKRKLDDLLSPKNDDQILSTKTE